MKITLLAGFVHLCEAFLLRGGWSWAFFLSRAEGSVYKICSCCFFPLPMLAGILPDFPVLQTWDDQQVVGDVGDGHGSPAVLHNVIVVLATNWRAPPSFDESTMSMAKAFSRLWNHRLTFPMWSKTSYSACWCLWRHGRRLLGRNGLAYPNNDADSKPCFSFLCDARLGSFLYRAYLSHIFLNSLRHVYGVPRWTMLRWRPVVLGGYSKRVPGALGTMSPLGRCGWSMRS